LGIFCAESEDLGVREMLEEWIKIEQKNIDETYSREKILI
jgi:hypothetical protein